MPENMHIPPIPDPDLSKVGAIQRQPDSINPLMNVGYRLVIERLPTVEWFCQMVNLPGMAVGSIDQTSMFAPIPRAGNVTFEELQIQFMVDENMQNYIELRNWLKDIVDIDDFDDFDRDKIHSQATILINTAKQNPNLKCVFHHMIPTALGGLDFDNTADSAERLVASATFRFSYYDLCTI